MGKHVSRYPLVDLFAGPGGFGEGFAEVYNSDGSSAFKSVASIEEDKHAHQTLLLRHFFRLFPRGEAPDSYYDYLACRIPKEELIDSYKREWARAEMSALHISLGKGSHGYVKQLISQRLRGVKKWILVGGPPCQAYSIAGRSRMIRNPNFADDERHFLYKEYLNILTDHRPPVFVMENVKGLLSAKVNGYQIFNEILEDLRRPKKAIKKRGAGSLSYNLFSFTYLNEGNENMDSRSYVIKTEEYGVPQARHRIFVLGVRSDLNISPNTLEKTPPHTVGQIIGDMPKVRSGVSGQTDSIDLWKNTITASGRSAWLKCNNKSNRLVMSTIRSAVEKIKTSNLKTSGKSRRYTPPKFMKSWYSDQRLQHPISHESRSHMKSDLLRYLFVSAYGTALGVSPTLSDFPIKLLPAHKNVAAGCSGGAFSDRFRVQIKSDVSTTITSHISKDGHSFIHYDPTQCRSFTVREAARIQTFPDNYSFEGPRTAQYQQVGNAVPPFLAKQIAEIVKEILDVMPERK